ncbi:MAG: hypothetical protein ACI845_000605, partial [Gammaproteobacteria bacterium]
METIIAWAFVPTTHFSHVIGTRGYDLVGSIDPS